jgi:hypothetical protein
MRWEYRRIQVEIGDVAKDDFEARLNEAGAEGWELVTAVQHERHGYSREVHLVLKRPAAE